MKYKPENVELVITYDGVEQEVVESNESTYIQNQPPKKTKPKRCKDTIDWVGEEYGDAYEKPYEYKIPYVNKKPKKGSQSCKQSSQSCKQSSQSCKQSSQSCKQSSQSCKQSSQSCKQSSQSCKQSISSTLVKQLTESEIESLRQNKRDAYALMMKID